MDGSVGASGFVNTSDERKKNIVGDVMLTVEHVASAPSKQFYWKIDGYDKNLHVGSTAQYWRTIMPEVVSISDDGTLNMEYGVAALMASIITARKVVDHERRIKELEEENKELKNIINRLKAA